MYMYMYMHMYMYVHTCGRSPELAELLNMGFSRDLALVALKSCANVSDAVDYCLQASPQRSDHSAPQRSDHSAPQRSDHSAPQRSDHSAPAHAAARHSSAFVCPANGTLGDATSASSTSSDATCTDGSKDAVLSVTSRRVRLYKEWREVSSKAGCSESVCLHAFA